MQGPQRRKKKKKEKLKNPQKESRVAQKAEQIQTDPLKAHVCCGRTSYYKKRRRCKIKKKGRSCVSIGEKGKRGGKVQHQRQMVVEKTRRTQYR